MAANTEEQVFNFEGNLESAWRQFFASMVIELKDASNPQTLPEDFVAVMVEVGAATGKAIHKPDGSSEYSQYEFKVEFTIRTERDNESSQNADIATRHQELVAMCRRWLSVGNARGSLDSYLTLYEINTLTPSASNRTASDDDYDETMLEYSGAFDILTNAFPSS